MGFNASSGKPAWCLGNVLMSIMSPWVTAGIKRGCQGGQDPSCASHSSAAPDFGAFGGMGMRVFPLGFGVLCQKGSGISRVWLWLSGLSKMRGGGRFSLTPQVSSPEGWHCKGGEQTLGDRACRATARGQQGPALGAPAQPWLQCPAQEAMRGCCKSQSCLSSGIKNVQRLITARASLRSRHRGRAGTAAAGRAAGESWAEGTQNQSPGGFSVGESPP